LAKKRRKVMRLPKFKYIEPLSVREASAVLADEPTAKVLAGGTDLLVNMKHWVEVPSTIVNIKKIAGLNRIDPDNGDLRIGALTTLKKIAASPAVRGKAPVLAQAASSVGSYHHQVMGTIGGNICQQNRCKYFNQSKWWRSSRELCFKAGGRVCYVMNKEEICYSAYCGDAAPALLVLQARADLTNASGERQVGLKEIFSRNGKAPLELKPGEILTGIIIPGEALGRYSRYVKFSNRQSIDFPIVGMALWASKEKKDYKVSFTAVDRSPVTAEASESFLQGRDLDPETISQAAELASKAAQPVKSSVYSPAFKRNLMGLMLKKAMNEFAGRS
jgi:4-hydroxybenzoyl-CoA reductase subunit beta